jgi:hypothetical protein
MPPPPPPPPKPAATAATAGAATHVPAQQGLPLLALPVQDADVARDVEEALVRDRVHAVGRGAAPNDPLKGHRRLEPHRAAIAGLPAAVLGHGAARGSQTFRFVRRRKSRAAVAVSRPYRPRGTHNPFLLALRAAAREPGLFLDDFIHGKLAVSRSPFSPIYSAPRGPIRAFAPVAPSEHQSHRSRSAKQRAAAARGAQPAAGARSTTAGPLPRGTPARATARPDPRPRA